MHRNTLWSFVTGFAVLSLVLVACGGTPPAAEEPEAPVAEEGGDEEMDQCMGAAAGDEVTILYQWAGVEEENFTSIIAPIVEACGIVVVPESSRDQALLQTRIESGEPWDIVVWPTRGPALSYRDMLQPLDQVGADASSYDSALVAAGSTGGIWITIPVKVDPKSVVWYSPANFEANGYTVPTTWDEFVALADQMVADGNVPFSMGFESGDATGWTGSDFIQDMLLATQGPDYVAGLMDGSVPYNDAGVAAAYEIYAGWAADPAYAVGGSSGTLSTAFIPAIYVPFDDPPGAMMVKQSGFAGGEVAAQFPELEQGVDYDFFPFPGAQGVQVGADFMAVFNNTPAVQALVHWLTSAEGGALWASTGFGFTPNLGASPADYPEGQQALAEFLASGAASPDLGDSIQPTFGSAEWTAIVNIVSGAQSIEAALSDAAAAQAADLGQ